MQEISPRSVAYLFGPLGKRKQNPCINIPLPVFEGSRNISGPSALHDASRYMPLKGAAIFAQTGPKAWLTPPCTTLLHLPALPRCSHLNGCTAPSPMPSSFPVSIQGLVLFLARDRLGGRAFAVRAVEAKLLLKAT